MHKYQPRFHVILIEPELEIQGHQVEDIGPDVMRENMRTFVFPETQFMAVTAYQNHMVSAENFMCVLAAIRQQMVITVRKYVEITSKLTVTRLVIARCHML